MPSWSIDPEKERYRPSSGKSGTNRAAALSSIGTSARRRGIVGECGVLAMCGVFAERRRSFEGIRGALMVWHAPCTPLAEAVRRPMNHRAPRARLRLGLRKAIIERRRDRSLFEAQAKQLEKVKWDLDQFTYAASHDLKAPLRGIASLSDWLEEDLAPVLTEQSRDQLRLLHGRVLRMEALIDGILAYSRASSRIKDKPEPIAVAPFLRTMVERLSPAPGTVAIDVPDSMPPVVAQKAAFEQVWANLLGNAMKHAAREDAAIRLAAKDAGDAWQLSVSDNGPGIAPQYHERIFRMFHMLVPRDKVEGAGIGLTIVKKLVEDRGGRVWVESEPGKGATFCFTWPKS
jgi:light-regulated signal transduction histidine kinase (bacteriophytochrome)